MAVNIRKIKEVSLLQHDSTDCGAACLASVIRYFGGESAIERIRRLSGTSQSGTTLLGLYQAALESGMDATGYEASVEDISAFPGVLILHITPEPGYDHYVVMYGYENDQFIIWDPASGLTFKRASEMVLIWKSRKCLAVSPGKDFKYYREERKKKLRWLFKTVGPDKELLLVSVFAGMVISVLGVVMAVFTQKLIDRILPSGEIRLLLVTSVLVFVLLCLRVIVSAIRQYMLLSQGKSFNIRVVDSFYSSLMGLPKTFFDTRKTGDMVARLNDTMRIQRVISDLVSVYIIDLLILIITTVMVFLYSVKAGFISLFAMPVFFLIVFTRNRRIIKSQNELMASYALNEGNYINSLRGITEIKSMNWENHYISRNKMIFSAFQESAFSLGKIKVSLGLLTGLAGTLYMIGLLIYASLSVMRSGMTQGELMAIISLSSTLLPSVMNLALVTVPLSEAKVAIERMFEFTRIAPEADKLTDEEVVKNFGSISVEKISFRFPGQKLFLSDIGLNINKGKITALVGESGSGKSTLLNIIMRFYLPESGRIMVNDHINSGRISLDQWRRSVGYVPQDVHLFNGTVIENLIPDQDEEKLAKLIKITTEYGFEAFINSLPLGFATLTGEDGIKLSGGQKQIIAFMRALINEPDILLVDEGTSGMDRVTEAHILDILTRLKKKTGILIVTHRINLIRKICDYVYIIEGGKVEVSGTHEDLMISDNTYRQFREDFM